ncbi:replication-relaxation family protein, partial [Glycomyces sp. A-F 0318]|uniref:replication-relaxation family protein n=1 Tax=Glycomyces amatae TaxID=2881355 RepID=UPI001E56670D
MCAKRIPGTDTGDFNEITNRLTRRDFDILEALEKHKIMTAGMIEAMFFPSRHQAGARLLTLHELGVVERWRSPESKAYRYVLAWRGQCILALIKGDKLPTKQAGTFQAQHQFLSRNRPHTEGVNAFFSRLYYSARNNSGIRVRWLAKDPWMLGIDPDGNGEISWQNGPVLPFWLEHDRGTETLGYLARKIKSYKEHTRRDSDARKSVLLIELPSERRLRNFLPVATEAWKADRPEWENPKLVVAACTSNQNERTFTHPEEFPNAF